MAAFGSEPDDTRRHQGLGVRLPTVPPLVHPLGHRSALPTMSLSCNITRAVLPLDGVFEEKDMAVCASIKSLHPIWRRHLTPRPEYQQQHPALFNKTLHCSTRLFRRSYFAASNLQPVSNYSFYSMPRRHSGLGSVRSQNIICMPAILPAEDAQQHARVASLVRWHSIFCCAHTQRRVRSN